MTTNLTFDLIDGSFKSAEAKRILFTLIKDKINFHELEMFSAYEKYGIELPHSKKRIVALKEALVSIDRLITESAKDDLDIQISGAIQIISVAKKETNEVF
ncbi:hypothetical protein [Flavobacterium sp. UBA6135]|uniref:hypothetical protein n=1 Tax=Flavobacterium sp. UBA6135 TaxID=1946553 RepID=UPI0025BB52D6|nr:hypothetical protein [Flavobacterium sp. UBA6135]